MLFPGRASSIGAIGHWIDSSWFSHSAIFSPTQGKSTTTTTTTTSTTTTTNTTNTITTTTTTTTTTTATIVSPITA